MRPPRYRFPDEVRSLTREIAARMVREGKVARTPEELDAWIAETPDIREGLERGGYGTHFTSHDLFPLLQVFAAGAGGRESAAERPPRSAGKLWLLGLLLLVVALLLLAVVVGALP